MWHYAQPGPGFFAMLGVVAVTVFAHATWQKDAFVGLFLTPTLWTLEEYFIHRFLMHGILSPSIKHAHKRHHERPKDETRIFIPMALSLMVGFANCLVMYAVYGSIWTATVNFASNIVCYGLFEAVHYSCHVGPPGFFPTAFHLRHHGAGTSNFGFTSATWDIVFGTCDPRWSSQLILLIPLPVLPLLFIKTPDVEN